MARAPRGAEVAGGASRGLDGLRRAAFNPPVARERASPWARRVRAGRGCPRTPRPGSGKVGGRGMPGRPSGNAREAKRGREEQMARCEVCGNDYDKAFQVTTSEGTHVFDSFECAIHRLAPTCGHCGCRILGHGVEASGTIYCCASCALGAGVGGMRDRV